MFKGLEPVSFLKLSSLLSLLLLLLLRETMDNENKGKSNSDLIYNTEKVL